eukprot:CAMPEP_0114382520 /NCGR_PEP_ID=MMETSP0102-20121206/4154_1 /TAXON_ID=38822 ORGANISM="Pteridomonas danica, Strain PT" /NCGR_SAMPLE_ID=MMETSP0102 /ASSEMBLY_ACC=CAM_ASM_000212 /LENGTH=683 /DNA_ID=CAMNT_0001538329 /DNA_START=2392 /DNA_END=4440 /DNA_ORIENTATION=-
MVRSFEQFHSKDIPEGFDISNYNVGYLSKNPYRESILSSSQSSTKISLSDLVKSVSENEINQPASSNFSSSSSSSVPRFKESLTLTHFPDLLNVNGGILSRTDKGTIIRHESALFIAARSGRSDICNELIELGASFNDDDPSFETLRDLLYNMCSTSTASSSSTTIEKDEEKKKDMEKVLLSLQIKHILLVLSHLDELERKSIPLENHPLYIAIEKGNVEIAKAMLKTNSPIIEVAIAPSEGGGLANAMGTDTLVGLALSYTEQDEEMVIEDDDFGEMAEKQYHHLHFEVIEDSRYETLNDDENEDDEENDEEEEDDDDDDDDEDEDDDDEFEEHNNNHRDFNHFKRNSMYGSDDDSVQNNREFRKKKKKHQKNKRKTISVKSVKKAKKVFTKPKGYKGSKALSIQWRTSNGWTLLSKAIYLGHFELVSILVDLGAYPIYTPKQEHRHHLTPTVSSSSSSSVAVAVAYKEIINDKNDNGDIELKKIQQNNKTTFFPSFSRKQTNNKESLELKTEFKYNHQDQERDQDHQGIRLSQDDENNYNNIHNHNRRMVHSRRDSSHQHGGTNHYINIPKPKWAPFINKTTTITSSHRAPLIRLSTLSQPTILHNKKTNMIKKENDDDDNNNNNSNEIPQQQSEPKPVPNAYTIALLREYHQSTVVQYLEYMNDGTKEFHDKIENAKIKL